MTHKALVAGIIGFLVGGAVVSGAAAIIGDDDSQNSGSQISTMDHNQATTDRLKKLKGNDFDKAFIEEMIMHHQGAIDMAKLTPTNAKHDEIKQLGQDIMSAQSKEIDMMQTWQVNWGYENVPESHNLHNM